MNVIAIAKKLGAKRTIADLDLAVEDPAKYLTKYAKRLRERGLTKPRKDLPQIALVDALVDERLAAEIDHRTFPEDVTDALDKLRSMPKARGRWKWAADIDEGTATEDFLALVANHVPLVMIDLGSDAYPVAVAKSRDVAALVKLGCVAIEPRAERAAPKKPGLTEKKLIAQEDREPWKEVRWVIAGTKRGDAIFGVCYDEPYLAYRFYNEWRGRHGFENTESTTRSGFASRETAVAAAEKQLADRIAEGWIRVSRPRYVELHKAVKRK